MSQVWITDRPPSPRYPLYTRANAGEILPRPVSPLGWTAVWQRGTVPGLADSHIRWGSFHPDELPPENAPVFQTFGGYMFTNWTILRMLGERTPGLSAKILDDAYFGDHPDLTPFEPPPDIDRADLAEKLDATMRFIVSQHAMPAELDDGRALALRVRGERPDFATTSDTDLARRVLYLAGPLRELFNPYCYYGTAVSFALGPLTMLCAESDSTLNAALMSGIGNVDSVPPSQAIWDLGRLVRASPALTAQFDAGLSGLDARLRADAEGASFSGAVAQVRTEHGARGPTEWDIACPTWETDPNLVLALVDRLRLADDSASPAARQARTKAVRAEALAKLKSHFIGRDDKQAEIDHAMRLADIYVPAREKTKLSQMIVVHEVRLAADELGRRLAERGQLDDPRLIMMATADELEQLIASPGELVDELRRRRRRYDELAGLQEPFFVDGVAPDISSWPTRGGATEAVSVGDVLQGVAGGPGVVTGVARIVRDPGDPRGLEPGEILVAPITDPAWTPLFVAAGGVAVEVGAPMSHAMIVSRELGIPCVTGIVGATSRIVDGTLLQVDGSAGTVTVLERASTPR